MELLPHFPDSATQWLSSPLGEALLTQESRIVEEALDGIFGEQCLQLGLCIKIFGSGTAERG